MMINNIVINNIIVNNIIINNMIINNMIISNIIVNNYEKKFSNNMVTINILKVRKNNLDDCDLKFN